VKGGQVDFVATIEDLKFFFSSQLDPVPSQQAATDAAGTWLRFSEELKQDLFYTFSPPEVTYLPQKDVTSVRAHAAVVTGGEGQIDVVITLGTAGSWVNIYEKS